MEETDSGSQDVAQVNGTPMEVDPIGNQRPKPAEEVDLYKRFWRNTVKQKDLHRLPSVLICQELRGLVSHCNKQSPGYGKLQPYFLLKTCYGIQKYLTDHGRDDNIFHDPCYETFYEELTTYLDNHEPMRTKIQGTVSEQYLWDIGQLGAKDPGTLLFTLVYFNYKYFHLNASRQHFDLNFNDFKVQTKAVAPGKLQKCLNLNNVKAKAKKGESEPSVKYFAWIFEQYKSKCQKPIEGPFYKQPILNDSMDGKDSKWFNTTRLPLDKLQHLVSRARIISNGADSTESHAKGIKLALRIGTENYKMNRAYRGKAVIFNHKEFKSSEHDTRHGTEHDAAELENTLSLLGFKVEIYDDLAFSEIKEIITALAAENHSTADCLLVAVMTHGHEGKLNASDTSYIASELWDPFTADKVRTLVGKPKIFIIQACQGDKLDDGSGRKTKKKKGAPKTETDSLSITLSKRRPTRSDFLMAFSCYPGYKSFRNTDYGSWFIQGICDALRRRYKTDDLLSIFTTVCNEVSYKEVRQTRMRGKKQAPFVQHTLTKKIYFNALGDIEMSDDEKN